MLLDFFSCGLAAELGSVFYSVKEKNFDERGLRKTADREFSRKAELESEMARQREQWVSNQQCAVLALMVF
jgi:pre-mRNA-splicing factor ATP-dependent RNA helicase DHX38/PRP16